MTKDGETGEFAVAVNKLDFDYSDNYGNLSPALRGIDFKLAPGSRCLLLGANGAGKSTLLRILAGKHLHEKDSVLVLGKPAFYQTLGVSGVNFLGGGWTRTIAFAGSNVPFQADIPVGEMMLNLQNEFPDRRDMLFEVLEIDPTWRMHQVSDGQRRRVQIMLGLLRPFKVLLLDEMTVDLDVLARRSFLDFLRKECEERGATVIYATHIFDGMGDWPTDVLMLEEGKMMRCDSYETIKSESTFTTLYDFVVDFLTDMLKKRQENEKNKVVEEAPEKEAEVKPFDRRETSGFHSGRMSAYFYASAK
mmetsp:Transcript_15961/g.28401  ORF Transcript_15961/g.28401 Transcript_15961/m.28401 type:complete len:305 (-) Transcript_15961:140-1054(-)|eukprot:CAMPEP_0184518912 /NCGR_PEP_ID=MMETSP0198_2-20121128/6337_1 /TAXON_ID=1112570 /ORGANISM="Thraustochytrium sp., Strain LLF1b" /LENGTH=304 /DNA_ID=CAMNT_0026909375 /DNA_START=196 /DNA_END=1110 /DNA_ORIENTATION=+